MTPVTRAPGEPLAPGFYGPFLFDGGTFRLHRVGPTYFSDPPAPTERWELRQEFCQPECMALPVGTSETEALRRFGFVLR